MTYPKFTAAHDETWADTLKSLIDYTSAFVTLATLMQIMPAVAAFFTMLWAFYRFLNERRKYLESSRKDEDARSKDE